MEQQKHKGGDLASVQSGAQTDTASRGTDLEMTKLCAAAMGFKLAGGNHGVPLWFDPSTPPSHGFFEYDPLHDDAQCFHLIEHCKLFVNYDKAGYWKVAPHGEGVHKGYDDLKRAVVETVARMRATES